MKRYVSIDEIVKDEKYPFTKSQLRHHVAKRKENGLATSIRKIGRRIYIREDLFDQWMDSHEEKESDSIREKKLATKIDDMEFSIRAYTILNDNRIKTVRELINKTEGWLLKIRSMGKRSLNEIKDKLASMDLGLKEE